MASQANIFRALRNRAGLTQQQVADALNCKVQPVSAWERGIAAPRAHLWEKLAVIYHVTTADIAETVRKHSMSRRSGGTVAA